MPFKLELLLLCFIFSLTGCAGDIKVEGDDPESSAAYLFEAGNDAMRDKNYVLSVKYYNRLKEDYPFSPYTVEAELSLADSYYLDAEWLLAAEAYKEFESMHPRHEAMPYVLYQIGMSNMNTYVSVDRPPTLIVEAYSYFRRLVESFPTHEYVSKAEFQIYKCRRIMAEYEVYTGDFMYRTKNYMAAWRRYMIVVKQYQDFPDLVGYSNKRRHIAYFMYMRADNEQTRRGREGTWHNWFNWL
jgi:outer membrane protein assembly factor BamD